MKADLHGIPIAPLTGPMDVRSNPDQLQRGSLRYRQNFQATALGKLRRGSGWSKLLTRPDYNNQDFHDQLLTLSNADEFTAIRQPVTLLFEAESTRKVRSLIAAKQGTVAKLNEHSGNWLILGTGYGGEQTESAAAPRFKAAQVGDYLALTNNFERPMYYRMEDVSVAGEPLLQTFDDFELIGLTRAGVVWSWRNVLFFADVTMDGERFGQRIIWSGYNNPLSFDPAALDSITGFKDLNNNETILAGKPVGNTFLIYTTHGIWEMAITGGDQSFSFSRRFNGEDNPGAAVLKYPNTLVQLPSAHAYLAEDGMYIFSPWYGQPERAEWLHVSTPTILDNIDNDSCQVHIAMFHENEMVISTASTSAVNACPDRTLRVNMTYRCADKVDHGYTAFCNYRSYDVPTVRDFIVENAICTQEEMLLAGYGYGREGLPSPEIAVTAPFTPMSIYTSTPQSIDPDITVEDWNQETADEDSLCALLGTTRMDDFCAKCEGPTLLVAASSQDLCLKGLGDVFYRERCVNPTGTGETIDLGYLSSVGSYLLDGYDSIIRFAPMYTERMLVQLGELEFDYLARMMESFVSLRVGIASQVADPNTDECRIVWFQHSSQPLKCISNLTVAQHIAKSTIPSQFCSWKILRKGRVVCAELKISGTGADADLSGIRADVKALEAQRF